MTWIDFHTHCLPHMDDGAKDAETSIEMLQHLRNQGVGAVVASPHFYAQRESMESFLSRREKAYVSIRQTVADLALPNLILGAEIHLIPNISAIDVSPLSLGGSKHVLLELPEHPYQRWLGQEIRKMTEKWGVFPIIAHLERYMGRYSRSDYADFLSVPNCICQFSVGALSRPSAIHFAKQLLRQGHTVLLGSDCHNLTTRPPNFSLIPQLSHRPNTRDFIDMIREHTSECGKKWGLMNKGWDS